MGEAEAERAEAAPGVGEGEPEGDELGGDGGVGGRARRIGGEQVERGGDTGAEPVVADGVAVRLAPSRVDVPGEAFAEPAGRRDGADAGTSSGEDLEAEQAVRHAGGQPVRLQSVGRVRDRDDERGGLGRRAGRVEAVGDGRGGVGRVRVDDGPQQDAEGVAGERFAPAVGVMGFAEPERVVEGAAQVLEEAEQDDLVGEREAVAPDADAAVGAGGFGLRLHEAADFPERWRRGHRFGFGAGPGGRRGGEQRREEDGGETPEGKGGARGGASVYPGASHGIRSLRAAGARRRERRGGSGRRP